ncbi:nucleoside triphosphate pyrophosphohydrolase [Vibrio phage D81]
MENKIFQAALDKWGVPSQVAMAHGEMGELATALTQYYVQEKVGPEAVVDEIVDVKIMMGQMTLQIEQEMNQPGAVGKRYKEKMERLAGMVGKTYIDKDNVEVWKVGEEFPPSSCRVIVNTGIKQPGMVRKPDDWVHGWFIGVTQCGEFAIVDIDDRHLVTAGVKDIAPSEPDKSVTSIHLRDYQKTVHVDVNLTPKTTQTTLDEREEILVKWPQAQPLREFLIEHDDLLPGSLVVNHHKVDPLKVENHMILNGELLHWYNMQYWFVIEAPQWEEAKAKQINQDAEALYSLVVGCDVNNPPWGSMKDSVKNLFIGLAELGIKPPRKELPKETELNLLFSAVSVRARDGGREIANRMYELGYRAPEGGTAKV